MAAILTRAQSASMVYSVEFCCLQFIEAIFSKSVYSTGILWFNTFKLKYNLKLVIWDVPWMLNETSKQRQADKYNIKWDTPFVADA